MEDLISRSALLKKAVDVLEYDEGGWDYEFKAVPVGEVVKAPAVDAVEVVRCKDCEKWKKKEETWLCWNFGYCSECMMDCHGDHFCSYGERRSNNAD